MGIEEVKAKRRAPTFNHSGESSAPRTGHKGGKKEVTSTTPAGKTGRFDPKGKVATARDGYGTLSIPIPAPKGLNAVEFTPVNSRGMRLKYRMDTGAKELVFPVSSLSAQMRIIGHTRVSVRGDGSLQVGNKVYQPASLDFQTGGRLLEGTGYRFVYNASTKEIEIYDYTATKQDVDAHKNAVGFIDGKGQVFFVDSRGQRFNFVEGLNKVADQLGVSRLDAGALVTAMTALSKNKTYGTAVEESFAANPDVRPGGMINYLQAAGENMVAAGQPAFQFLPPSIFQPQTIRTQDFLINDYFMEAASHSAKARGTGQTAGAGVTTGNNSRLNAINNASTVSTTPSANATGEVKITVDPTAELTPGQEQ